MTGIDTNILVRYIVRDHAVQTALATRFLEKECAPENPGHISAVVLCEMVWVIERGYRYSRDEIAITIRSLLTAVELRVEHAAEARSALEDYASGAAGFTDYFLARINKSMGAPITVTFDEDAASHPLFRLLR